MTAPHRVYAIRRPVTLQIEADSLDAAWAEADRVLALALWLAANQGLVRLKEEEA